MRLERLESRRLWSVTVIQGFPGFYEVHGDDTDNDISIHISVEREEFTLDGQTYTGVQQLTVYGMGGNDSITVAANALGLVSASVDGGEGDDQISINLDGAARGGGGNDSIYLYDSFRGEVYGQEGDDYIWLGGSNIDANIHGGEGNDYINASTNNYRIFIHGGGGNDTIYGSDFDDQLFGGLGMDIIFAQGGNDEVFSFDNEYDFAFGGGGIDTAYLDTYEGYVEGFEHVFLAETGTS
jgi:Ca2+-binding RTX toxin-like protein